MSIVQPFNNVDKTKFNVINPFFVSNKKMDLTKVNTVVLHWTAGANINNDIITLKKKSYGYHFLITTDGVITQGSPVNKKLSHAGSSYGPNGNFVNGHSISISFSMLGDENIRKGSTVFNENQIDSCISLLLDLKESVPSLKYITGHHWISPGRKVDPYTLNFDEMLIKTKNGKTLKSVGYELWKTGYLPFPSHLKDCKCIEKDSVGNCLKSTGLCSGAGGLSYSERKLSTKVSELSFASDMDTE